MANVQRFYFEDGNTVRTINEPLPSLEERRREQKRRREIQKRRQNRKRKAMMRRNKLNAIFFGAFLVFAIAFFGSYVFMQTSIQESNRSIASLEGEISDLKAQNMSMTNRINAEANLDNVKDAAVNRLGMNYATPDHIVYYNIDDDVFMSQYKDIP
jgi:cell division protein FtsL